MSEDIAAGPIRRGRDKTPRKPGVLALSRAKTEARAEKTQSLAQGVSVQSAAKLGQPRDDQARPPVVSAHGGDKAEVKAWEYKVLSPVLERVPDRDTVSPPHYGKTL